MDASLDRGWREVLDKAQAKTSETYQHIASLCYRIDAGTGTGLEQLRDILSTLRLILGTINSLSLLIVELQSQQNISDLRGPQPDHNILDAMSGILDYLNRPHLEYPIDNRIPKRLHAVLDTLRTAAASHDCLGMEACLITNDPPMALSDYGQEAPETEGSSHEDAVSCLAEVMRIRMKPPQDLLSYQSHVAQRDLAYPRYSNCAWRLPALVKKHWDSAIRTRVESLFSPVKPGLFEYWVLEYATRQWPERFDTTKALSKAHFKRLMTMVSDPSLQPLHVAAAFGLVDLFEDSAANETDDMLIGAVSPFGTLLYCALLGPNALLALVDDPMQLAADLLQTPSQRDTIAKVALMTHYLRAGQSGLSITGPNQDEPVSLATLAFLICHSLNDPELFNLILSFEPALDERFVQLFLGKHSIANYWPSTLPELSLSFLKKVLPPLIDYAAINYTSQGVVSPLLKGVYEVIEHFRLESIIPATKLPNLPDDRYCDLVREIVQDNDFLFLRRFICDPRWQPDISLVAGNAWKPKRTTILHYAVECNMVASVALMLSTSATVDINARNENEQTPLMLSESPEMFKILKCHGARTTDTDDSGRNIWHIAAANADVNLIDCLMEHDENMDQNLRGLMRGGQTPIAQSIVYPLLLLKEGSDVTGKSPVGALHLLKSCKKDPAYLRNPTPLILLAAKWGSKPLVTALLEFGADPNSVDEMGQSALHYLDTSATTDLIRTLQKACQAPTANHEGLTPAETILEDMYYPPLAELRRLDMAAYHLLLTPEVLSSRNKEGHGLWERFAARLTPQNSPLWDDEETAECASMKSAINSLIAKGAVKSYEKEKREPGLMAILKAFPGIMMPDISTSTEWAFNIIIRTSTEKEKLKNSPDAVRLLKIAVNQDRPAMVRSLLALGVSVHVRESSPVQLAEDKTVWMRPEAISVLEDACEIDSCEKEMFEILLSCADANKLNEDRPFGKGFLDRLINVDQDSYLHERDHKLKKLLEKGLNPNPKSGVKGRPAMVAYIEGGHLSATLSLLQHGGDVSAKDESGMNAPLAAARMGSIELLEEMVKLRPDMDLRATCSASLKTRLPGDLDQAMTLWECNGLHLAAFEGHAVLFGFFIERHGLDVNAVTQDDLWTPLHCAAYGGHASCVRSLVEFGADLTAEDSRGHTPLTVAVKLRRKEVVRVLLELGSKAVEGTTAYLLAREPGYEEMLQLFASLQAPTAPPSNLDV